MAITSINQLSPERRDAYNKSLANIRPGNNPTTISPAGTDPVFNSGSSQISKRGTTIDPNVLGLRDSGKAMVDTSISRLRTDRTNILGNKDTFVERRTAPLQDTINTQRTALTERLDKTGVTGEFGRQTQESFNVSAQQKLASGEQLALNEFTSLANNLDNIEGGMLKLMEGIDFNAFSQDLQARGLSQDLSNQLNRIKLGEVGRDQAKKAQDEQQAGNLLLLIASLFSGGGEAPPVP